MFSLFTPADGGLLPPVAGREGAAAEKSNFQAFWGEKSTKDLLHFYITWLLF